MRRFVRTSSTAASEASKSANKEHKQNTSTDRVLAALECFGDICKDAACHFSDLGAPQQAVDMRPAPRECEGVHRQQATLSRPENVSAPTLIAEDSDRITVLQIAVAGLEAQRADANINILPQHNKSTTGEHDRSAYIDG